MGFQRSIATPQQIEARDRFRKRQAQLARIGRIAIRWVNRPQSIQKEKDLDSLINACDRFTKRKTS